MQNTDSSDTERQQYIIGHVESGTGSTISLTDIVEKLNADPRAEVVQVQGSPADPSLIIASLTPELAQQLQAQHQGQLIVEENLPLQPF